jgi:hypothetical protein
MLAHALSVLLLLLTRDGVLHQVEGEHDQRVAATFAQPRDAAALADGAVAVLHAGQLLVLEHGRQRQVPGSFVDLYALADGGGDQLLAVTAGGDAVTIDRRSGKRTARGARLGHFIASDRGALFAVRDQQIVELAPTVAAWPVPGRPIALAAADGKLYVATHEGPLYEIDRGSGARRDLGLGGWWGTLALAAGGGKLYAVTVAGKLWEIDPRAGTKTILAMSGWESALSLSLLR